MRILNYICILWFLGVKSHSTRVKILSLLKKSEKFAYFNKSDRFLLFWSDSLQKRNNITFLLEWISPPSPSQKNSENFIQECKFFILFYNNGSILTLLEWDFTPRNLENIHPFFYILYVYRELLREKRISLPRLPN